MTATQTAKQAATQEHERDYAHALAQLRGLLPEGSTVYTVLRSVSRSGMSRRISFKAITLDGTFKNASVNSQVLVHHLDGYISTILGFTLPRYDKPQGLRVDGCGEDQGYKIVHNLSRVLHPDAEQVGYSLKHRWL
jgi:hypothetical protein